MRAVFISTVLPFAPWAAELQRHFPSLELCCWPDPGDPAAVEAALVWCPPPGALAAFPKLQIIHALGAGVDDVLADPLYPAGVPLVRLVDPFMTAAMVEYVELQVLRLHRHDLVYRAQQRERVWREHAQPNAGERRVGILGLGALGSEAALRLKVMGFDVAGWSRSARRVKGIANYQGGDGLAALAGRSEIVVCLLPLTPDTAGILDARLFAAMPRGASLVNCGRGAHLVEADLLAALEHGQIAAAILDVFREEPLPQAHPFWSHPHIVVTPHAAAASNPRTAAPIVAAALQRFAEGKRIANLVQRERGY